uniref:Lipoyl-binding domain-containing protein n=1 Tax=Leersia perrieri TaxID=77586 RepID=A0A0D9VCQ7_9ORYZ
MEIFDYLKQRYDYTPPDDFLDDVLPPEAFGGDSCGIPSDPPAAYLLPMYELHAAVDKELLRRLIEEQRQQEEEQQEERVRLQRYDDDDLVQHLLLICSVRLPRMAQMLWGKASRRARKRGKWPHVKRARTTDAEIQEDLSELELELEETRRRIYECNCNNVPRHTLFRSNANHLNPEWLRPSTLEGDLQYIIFFHKLMDTVEHGNTEDEVLAKAITIARKSFQKILYFQIEAAAQDCLKLIEHMERMNDRYDFYHFFVSEILFNNKSYEDVLKLIRDGHVELHFTLNEFNSPGVDHRVDDLVNRLVDMARVDMPTDAQREGGMFKDWVCQLVDEEYGSCTYLYMDFLKNKMRDHLGYVEYVELPEVGSSVSQGKNFAAVRSVEGTTSRIHSPVSGDVVEVNNELGDVPGLVNASPYKKGWIIKVKMSDPGELNSLMDGENYSKFYKQEEDKY